MSKLEYGDVVYLHNQGDDNENRWLTGCRDKGNQNVRTDDKNTEPELISSYKWQICRSFADVGSGSIENNSTVFLKCMYSKAGDNVWLTGGREKGNQSVFTRKADLDQSKVNYFKWELERQVPNDNRFFLNLRDIPRELFLTGGRGSGQHEVKTLHERDLRSTFTWLLEKA